MSGGFVRLILQTEKRFEKFCSSERLVLQTVLLLLQVVRLVLQDLSTGAKLRRAFVSPGKICKRKRTPYFVQISAIDFVRENARITSVEPLLLEHNFTFQQFRIKDNIIRDDALNAE